MEEAIEVTKIYSVSGLLPQDTPVIMERPFRSPHYTISHAGLVGGGQWPRPGGERERDEGCEGGWAHPGVQEGAFFCRPYDDPFRQPEWQPPGSGPPELRLPACLVPLEGIVVAGTRVFSVIFIAGDGVETRVSLMEEEVHRSSGTVPLL